MKEYKIIVCSNATDLEGSLDYWAKYFWELVNYSCYKDGTDIIFTAALVRQKFQEDPDHNEVLERG